MTELSTRADFRHATRIGFCCICGRTLDPRDKTDRQHTPPKSVFAIEDRDWPLILPAHEVCNREQSPLDTVIAQLVSVLHGKHANPRDRRLDVGVYRDAEGRHVVGVTNLPFRRILFRWVRCFHAALYGCFLEDRGGMIYEPLPAGDLIGEQLVAAVVPFDRPFLTHAFKQQLKAGRTDGITCYNGKCVYRCTWLSMDDGTPFCLFALRLYNWEELGDRRRMGCVGFYYATTPPNATLGTSVEIAVSSLRPLDPFAL